MGFQFTLEFEETALEFETFTAEALPITSSEIGNRDSLTSQGTLTTCWVDAKRNIRIEDGESLFRVRFKALQNARLSDILVASSRITKNKSYRFDLEQDLKVYLDFGLSTGLENPAADQLQVFQSEPNPMDNYTQIPVQLTQAGNLALTITNATGQIVHSSQQAFPAGLQLLSLNRDDFGAAGIYFYTIQQDGFQVTRKLLVR